MLQYNHQITDIDNLTEILQSRKLRLSAKSKSQLIQIYSARKDQGWYLTLGAIIRKAFPSAIIVGASSIGEIKDGHLLSDSTVISFSFFQSSSLYLRSYECLASDEEAIADQLFNDVKSAKINAKGILLLSTPIANNPSTFFNRFTAHNLGYPVFGGGAGNHTNLHDAQIFDGKRCYEQGIIAVIFSGENLFIEPLSYLGWNALSKEMTITGMDNMSVKSIDDNPASSIYEKYLGITCDDDFFLNVLEFPLLIYRKNNTIARVPFKANKETGSILFLGDINEGEKCRIGYGNPQKIIADSVHIRKKMQKFQPQAIFLYTCICRRFLMQQEVELETLHFNTIAPTAGFYTFGEFFANATNSALLNSTMVAVGIREGEKPDQNDNTQQIDLQQINHDEQSDPYDNKHARILSHLLYFINTTTKEIEDKNKKLARLNKQKNEFLGIAAHDIRNPLGAILSITQLLEDEIKDEKHKGYLSIITEAGTSMLNLLNNLLDISKIESDNLNFEKKETDYIALVKSNLKINKFIAKNKNIKIASELQLPEIILSINSDRIEQVLNNLIGNAIKYSYPSSTIAVKVFLENNRITTQIIDHGKGIPEDEIDEIFRPFKTTSVTPTGGESSHGLGLSIAKKIIENHNGNIEIYTELGKGSTFTFTLPVPEKKEPDNTYPTNS